MLSWLSSWIWELDAKDPDALNPDSIHFKSYPARNFPFTNSTANGKLKDVSLKEQVENQLKKLRNIQVPPRPTSFPIRHPVLRQLLEEIPRIE